MTKVFTLVSSLLFFSFTQTIGQPSSVTVGSTTLDVRVVIEGSNSTNGIDIPWEIQWGSDDHIWMTEQYGPSCERNYFNNTAKAYGNTDPFNPPWCWHIDIEKQDLYIYVKDDATLSNIQLKWH